MPEKNLSAGLGRRRFLAQAGGLACLGCGALLARQDVKSSAPDHKFQEDSLLSRREVVQFSALFSYVPLLQRLGKRFGENKFVQIMQEDTRAFWTERMQAWLPTLEKKDMATFFSVLQRINSALFPGRDPQVVAQLLEDAKTVEEVLHTEKVVELRVTECLFAQVYREANAWSIGYITHCFPDFVLAKAFDPRMRLTRSKTLMRGDDHCNHRYSWEA